MSTGPLALVKKSAKELNEMSPSPDRTKKEKVRQNQASVENVRQQPVMQGDQPYINAKLVNRTQTQ